MDEWGVTQSTDQDTSGMWIKYGTSEACADRFRQPMTGFPKSRWLSCCAIEMSRNRKEYFTIIVKACVEKHGSNLLAFNYMPKL